MSRSRLNTVHTDPVTALLEVGAGIPWPDADAARAARENTDPRAGRLGDLVEWLASVQGEFPPKPPARARLVGLGEVPDHVHALAGTLDVGVRTLALPGDANAAFTAGRDAADAEVDEGADLIVLAGVTDPTAAAALISVVTGAEPVALLPRGAAAVDTAAWIEQAAQVRDARRRIAALRSRPDDLLAALADAPVAASVAFALRAAARRTPVILDGTTVLAGALLGIDSQARAIRWWQVADTSPDQVHSRAVAELAVRPVLDLGTRLQDGTAGLLAVAALRAAVMAGVPDG